MIEPVKEINKVINTDTTLAPPIDTALANCKKTLIIISSVLLALTFSGAKVTEANTFIFKITFTNPTGINTLLLLSIGYLLLRYNSISHIYTDNYKKQFATRVLENKFFRRYDSYNDVVDGFIPDLLKPKIYINDDKYKHSNHSYLDYDLKVRLFFNAYIDLTEYDEHGNPYLYRFYLIGSKDKLQYLFALSIMLSHWFLEQFRQRDFLELYSPMFIGFIAVYSSVLVRLTS
ncbi:hypothetical protein PSH47_14255 [Pseudoalteromonas sp. CST5]|uniref:hypothetical protein n=1 Tax=unclassified Pseudoalteromonas TaxID=194690 RepID=UPI0023585A8D|nr:MULTISPECIES: hypothetical protein [unclassified Pseudoalteromonas]MDC9515104.1 hypothetical protein [Pseudoalteromonas sp. CST1]MDC9539285.1 hypothetical protein [Pseudoalteromonas sp. CST3]MDC9542781.1 hypothetical protein [Pseudoalteromonas sp. CST2]MDC9547479.1 hypothetical protein [Pseudoalteromonas sp. CST4]MDC9550315.1 hypothetical protein [Pseudoalteromonas sp. CST5]